MISQAAQDWTDNPVVTSTDNVEAPIKDLPFPSLSVCQKDPNYHKNWQVPELIFNFIDVQKSDTKVQEMLVGFSNFTKKVAKEYLASESFYNTLAWKIIQFSADAEGLTEGLGPLIHDVYCELAVKINETLEVNPDYLEKLKIRLADLASKCQIFTLDQLLKEFDLVKGSTLGMILTFLYEIIYAI